MKALKGVLIGSLLGALLLLGAPSTALADKSDRWDKSGQDAKAHDPHDGENKGAPGHGGDKSADKGDRNADKGDKGNRNGDRNGDKNGNKDENKRADKGDNKSADRGEKRHDGHDADRDNRDYYYDGYYYGPGYCGYYGNCGYYDNYYGESTSTFLAYMTGGQVVPTPGPRMAKGNAELDVNPYEHRVCFKLSYQGIDHPTGAHIHHGRPGEAGPMAVDLNLEANGNQGCVGAPYGVLRAIQADPHGFYLQVHTADFPDGAMRGQLVSPGEGGYY